MKYKTRKKPTPFKRNHITQAQFREAMQWINCWGKLDNYSSESEDFIKGYKQCIDDVFHKLDNYAFRGKNVRFDINNESKLSLKERILKEMVK